MPVIWLGYVAAGPKTKMFFYEAAAHLLCAVTSGAPSVQTPHPAKAVMTDGITPTEARFGVETAIAASKLNREEANEIVIRLLQRYEPQIESPPPASRYQDCYDVVTGKPSEDYVRLYDEVKEELAGMSVPF
jgi:methylamine--corrinoid protein Co-methyltransferase